MRLYKDISKKFYLLLILGLVCFLVIQLGLFKNKPVCRTTLTKQILDEQALFNEWMKYRAGDYICLDEECKYSDLSIEKDILEYKHCHPEHETLVNVRKYTALSDKTINALWTDNVLFFAREKQEKYYSLHKKEIDKSIEKLTKDLEVQK